MDYAVIQYYRRLLKTGFEHAGSFENASMLLDATGDRAINCGETDSFMRLYIQVAANAIEDIKYMCSCGPTTNVAVEILCALVKGKTLDEAARVEEKAFSRFLGSESEELATKARALLGLLNDGIARHRAQALSGGPRSPSAA
jgi:NifU-like protein involved in Fe-S cluster formation